VTLRRWINGLLLLGSFAVAVLALEGLLRLTLSPARLVGGAPDRPEVNQWHNELRYLSRYRDRPPSELHRHDPLLGWDSNYGETRVRGRSVVPDSPGLRAVAVGDSFVFGNDVEPGENFSALLDSAPNALQVLNMGVPGYGIDQSHLKLKHHGLRLEPDLVLFGIFVGDYERTTVAFTTFAKPRFVLQDDALTLTNQPVADPAAELERIAAALDGRWYLQELLANLYRKLNPLDDASFFDASDRIVRAILQDLADSVGGRRLLVIHFPRGESFSTPDPFHTTVHQRLLKIYRTLGIEFIDLAEEFRTSNPAGPAAAFFVVQEDGDIGHLNPAGHRRVAELIAARLGLPKL
jgi:hypothetical protein